MAVDDDRSKVLTWLLNLPVNRPAELTAAIAGAVGLVTAQVVGSGGADGIRTGLVVLLSVLPAVVSTIYDLGHNRRAAHDIEAELDELTLRAVRRARLESEGWINDKKAVEEISAMIRQRRQKASPPGGTAGAGTGQGTGD